MPIVLQFSIRNLLSACHFNFDLFHVSPKLVVYLFNIFSSPRLTFVHLFWKKRRTLSVYMQKMNKPFVTFNTFTDKKKKKKKTKQKKTDQDSNLCGVVFHIKTLTVVHLCNHWDTIAFSLKCLLIISISLTWKLYTPVLSNRHIPK